MPRETESPLVPVSLELAAALDPGGDFPREYCRRAVAESVDRLMGVLGVPGRAHVSIATTEALTLERPLKLTINGQLCRYPDELLWWIASYVKGTLPRFVHPLDQELAEIVSSAKPDGVTANTPAADFVTLACHEIASLRATALVSLEQAEAYAATLAQFSSARTAGGVWPPSGAWLLMILRELIALRVSVRNRRLVATILAEAGARDDGVAIVEALLSALLVREVEVLVSPDDQGLFLNEGPNTVGDRFNFLRRGLFAETGVEYPPFRLSISGDLRPGAFAFKIGCLRTNPVMRLQSNECMVNDTAERLSGRVSPEATAQNPIDARATMNPANGLPSAIVPLDQRPLLAGLTTWDSQEHLVLCMAEALRRYGQCFVDSTFAGSRLRSVEGQYPALATAVTDSYSTAQIARTMRRLLAEEVSIRNVRLIFDQLVEQAEFRRDEGRLLERVRAGLRAVIREKLARGSATVVVYLLDPGVEERLAAQRWRRQTEEALCENVLGAVRAEIRELRRIAPTASVPSILTTSQARSSVHAIIASEFPRLAVISYEDLPRDTNVMPVARIAYRTT